MSAPHAHCVKIGHVARITLDRPDVLNAMDLQMHEELGRIWTEIEADDEVRLAVLTGAGERAFSVGQDLRERASLDEAGVERTGLGSRALPGWPRLTDRFDLTKPIIARVDGYALGGGFELALACDLIIASDRSVFGLPEARLGLIPGAGGIFRLPRQFPFKVAMGYLLTGRRMDASTALGYGLVNEVVPAARLNCCVESWVEDLLQCAPLSLRAIKQVVTESLDRPIQEGFSRHYEYDELRRRSQDSVEGPRAFAEGRPPRWTGR